MCEALRDAWLLVASRPPTDARATEAILRDHAVQWEGSQIDSQTAESFRAAALRARQTAPGPDGVGYRFWAVERSNAPASLLEVIWPMVGRCAPPAGFNSAIMAFGAKGRTSSLPPLEAVGLVGPWPRS